MKFLEDVYFSIDTWCIQNFSNWHALFVFLSFSIAVAASSGIQCVDPQMIHWFWAFLSLGAQEPVEHPKNICLVLAAGKNIFRVFILKRYHHPGPLDSEAFACTSYKFEARWTLLDRLSRGFFLPAQGPLI